MEAIRKQARKLREQVARQQQYRTWTSMTASHFPATSDEDQAVAQCALSCRYEVLQPPTEGEPFESLRPRRRVCRGVRIRAVDEEDDQQQQLMEVKFVHRHLVWPPMTISTDLHSSNTSKLLDDNKHIISIKPDYLDTKVKV